MRNPGSRALPISHALLIRAAAMRGQAVESALNSRILGQKRSRKAGGNGPPLDGVRRRGKDAGFRCGHPFSKPSVAAESRCAPGLSVKPLTNVSQPRGEKVKLIVVTVIGAVALSGHADATSKKKSEPNPQAKVIENFNKSLAELKAASMSYGKKNVRLMIAEFNASGIEGMAWVGEDLYTARSRRGLTTTSPRRCLTKGVTTKRANYTFMLLKRLSDRATQPCARELVSVSMTFARQRPSSLSPASLPTR